ncbi:MAG: hypothetical protein JWQ09_439 [Segetibacter sp.]|nr:hypothetical protein [Segetibacter sp.]
MIKWVARLAFLTGLLGLAGTIVIISHLHGKHEKKEETAKRDLKVDTQIIKPQPKRPISSTAAKPIVEKKDPPPKILPHKEVTEEKAAKIEATKIEEKKKDAEKIENAGKAVKQNDIKNDQEERLFSEEELQQLITDINTAKEEHDIYSNCVQIYTTRQGNNKRAVSQLETYLRSHRFAIAGRETISKRVKGIQISPVGGCIRITVGSL